MKSNKDRVTAELIQAKSRIAELEALLTETMQRASNNCPVCEKAPFGLFIAELPSGRFLLLNQTTAQMFGWERGQSLKLGLTQLVHPKERETLRTWLSSLAQGRPLDREPKVFTGLRRNQSTFRFDVMVSRVEHQGKSAIQGILRDVTEKEYLDKQRRHVQKMEAMGILANGVAHEFNNILMAIRGYSQLIAIETAGSQRLERLLGRINDHADRAAELTGKLLSFSNLELGEKAPVNLNQVIESVMEKLGQTLPAGIRLTSDLTPDLPVILASRGQLEQALTNIALNARDAMPEGGRISFTTRSISLDEAFRETNPWATTGRYLEIVVTDTGKGMPSEVLEHVFEPFFTTKEPGRGTGLGLSVVYSIVKNHNGYILANSQWGHGTQILIYLPAGEIVVGGTVDLLNEPSLRHGQGECVLVVDDEEVIRNIYRTTLESFGYETQSASNGGEALRLYREALNRDRPFHLVILDFAMPVMDGAQCALRLLELHPQARIIMATGHASEHLKTNGLQARLAGIIEKPFDLRDLVAEVGRVLEDQPAADPNG
ncbi:MAG: response regulator [Thermodesulfobacteriota bacterium]